MIITKKALPRRTVLRGLGASLALPWLDSMVPALTALSKSAAAPPRRFGVFYVPNGMSMPFWWPRTVGVMETLPSILEPLQAQKDQVLLLGGLDLNSGAGLKRGGGPHSRSSGAFLTGVPIEVITESNVTAAKTVDQIVAAQFGKDTQIASLELGMESTAVGTCELVNCAVSNGIAWSAPNTPLPVENDPRAVFERLFGMSGSTDATVRLARLRRDRSLLDMLSEHIGRLNTHLGPHDRLKFEEYLTSVRDIERRIQKAEEQNTRELPVVEHPMGVPTDYGEHAKLMMDLLVLAFQTDMTRVSTFMFGHELSGRAYPEIGVSESHHPLSHHGFDPAKLERLQKVNIYHAQQFAHLVTKLSGIAEGDGTMLDHSLFMYGGGISDGQTHSNIDLPISLVAGKATGIKGGRYLRYPKGTPLANVHLTLLNKIGVHLDTFGNSTGSLPDLDGVMLTEL
jgi:hypothetical protein